MNPIVSASRRRDPAPSPRRSPRSVASGTGRVLLLALAAGVGGAGCERSPETLLLASTTSTEDSGLFDVLLPAFEQAHPEYEVHVTAVGTGQALMLGRRKDADVLLVHAPADEARFVEEGYGTARCQVMYNDFVIVGPPTDPADVAGVQDAAVALERIADRGAPFVSRGDDSGTHRKERSLWQAAGIEPTGAWYLEIGQGMGEALRMASEKRAYTLTDRSTYLNMREGVDLPVLLEGDPQQFNPYGVIPVVGATNPEGAVAFARWITGPEGQAVIRSYGVERFGSPLFIPAASDCTI